MSGRIYKRTRVRGFAPWQPRADSLALVGQVTAILQEYADYLPMTARQVFYRLVGAYGFPKDEGAYGQLLEKLGRARRARLIPMTAIRDDGASAVYPHGYRDPGEFTDQVRALADLYVRHLDQDQPRAIEVWVEAAGMMQMLARAAHAFGASVHSSGGFESVTAKHEAARRIAHREVPTVVVHIGDLDPSGLSILDSAADDVCAFVEDMGGPAPTFTRLAVTPEQAERFGLPTAPQKPADRRGAHMTATVQAEALAPDQLIGELRACLAGLVDHAALARVRERSERERAELLASLDGGVVVGERPWDRGDFTLWRSDGRWWLYDPDGEPVEDDRFGYAGTLSPRAVTAAQRAAAAIVKKITGRRVTGWDPDVSSRSIHGDSSWRACLGT